MIRARDKDTHVSNGLQFVNSKRNKETDSFEDIETLYGRSKLTGYNLIYEDDIFIFK